MGEIVYKLLCTSQWFLICRLDEPNFYTERLDQLALE